MMVKVFLQEKKKKKIRSITSGWKFAPLLPPERLESAEATTCQRGTCASLLLGASRKASSPQHGLDKQWRVQCQPLAGQFKHQ